MGDEEQTVEQQLRARITELERQVDIRSMMALPRVKIQPFSGKTNEDPQAWLTATEQKFEWLRIKDEKIMAQVASEGFEGAAFTWWWSYFRAAQQVKADITWTSLCTNLLSQYGHAGYTQRILSELDNLTFDGKSYLRYADHFRQLKNRLNGADRTDFDLIRNLVDPLPIAIRQLFFATHPNEITVDVAIEFVRRQQLAATNTQGKNHHRVHSQAINTRMFGSTFTNLEPTRNSASVENQGVPMDLGNISVRQDPNLHAVFRRSNQQSSRAQGQPARTPVCWDCSGPHKRGDPNCSNRKIPRSMRTTPSNGRSHTHQPVHRLNTLCVVDDDDSMDIDTSQTDTSHLFHFERITTRQGVYNEQRESDRQNEADEFEFFNFISDEDAFEPEDVTDDSSNSNRSTSQLITVDATIGDVYGQVLLDTGASCNFIDGLVVQQLNDEPHGQPHQIALAVDSDRPFSTLGQSTGSLTIDAAPVHDEATSFEVLNHLSFGCIAILGLPWLKAHRAQLDWTVPTWRIL